MFCCCSWTKSSRWEAGQCSSLPRVLWCELFNEARWEARRYVPDTFLISGGISSHERPMGSQGHAVTGETWGSVICLHIFKTASSVVWPLQGSDEFEGRVVWTLLWISGTQKALRRASLNISDIVLERQNCQQVENPVNYRLHVAFDSLHARCISTTTDNCFEDATVRL